MSEAIIEENNAEGAMMIVRLLLIAAILCVVLSALAGCSREQSDWKTAQAADTIEAYGVFLRKHADASVANEARMRIEQLGEERDWQRASISDTRETYAQFIALHPNSKWTQEARIRIENFALGPMPVPASGPAAAPQASTAPPASAPARAVAPAEAAVPIQSPAPARPPKPAVMAAGSRLIQLGAFNSERIARARWERLAGKYPQLSSLTPQTEDVERGGKTLIRLRATVGDSFLAEKLCTTLQRGGDDCFVVARRR